MIRNEKEYQEAIHRIQDEKNRLEQERQRLKGQGLPSKEIERAVNPFLSFHLQLEEEVEAYERLKRGDLDEIMNLHGFGQTLIGLRIALGFTQRELAKKLGVDESQVSRDERNEYYGITTTRAMEILDAMGVEMTSRFVIPSESPGKKPRKQA
ncbi:MAG: helix-turn-helix domain-containing protein [Deltaproteobacteria bacterium]|nr:helix-turn-helix domain-containing protein [Deltaproteobacteria bacterium]